MADIPEELYHLALQNVSDGVYFCDTERRITYWNPAAELITGFATDEVRGLSCADGILTHVDLNGAPLCETSCPLTASLRDCTEQVAEVYLHHKEGFRVPVTVRTLPVCAEDGTVYGVAEIFTDNSPLADALEKMEKLSVQAETDALTGAANRRSMENDLASSIAERRRTEGFIGVLFVDIDHFKAINDTFGHEAGDQVLKMVTQTLKHNLRGTDSLARWGGDEFLAMLRNTDADGIQYLAEKLRTLVSSSYLTTAEGRELRVTVSAGATLLRPGDSSRSLLARVDKLLYESKAQGRDRVTWAE